MRSPSRSHRRRRGLRGFERLEPRRLLAADLQNPVNPLDVNDDSYVSSLDALLVVNALNENQTIADVGAAGGDYLDTNGDCHLSAVDALLVINELNASPELQPEIVLSAPQASGLVVGEPGEVNINKVQVGPRGWIFGSSEENGYLFIVDQETGDAVQWNAGRNEPVEGRRFEGDVTDFVVWEQDSQFTILAATVGPAEIYRYVLPIPDSGLPDLDQMTSERVYVNEDWLRVMSIERVEVNGQTRIYAGSYTNAELLLSDDLGDSWRSVDYWAGVAEIDANDYKQRLREHPHAAIVDIQQVEDVLVMFLYHGFLLESQRPWSDGHRHFVNGILVSRDFGVTWELSQVEPNPRLPESLQQDITADQASSGLHPHLYGMVGESPQRMTVLDDGTWLAGTGLDNFPEFPFGGRVLASVDQGRTWTERYHFADHTNLFLASHGNVVFAGTTTAVWPLPEGQLATGDIFVSSNGGRSFRFALRVVEESRRSAFRLLHYAGVGSLFATSSQLVIGTVNEAAVGELLVLDWSA